MINKKENINKGNDFSKKKVRPLFLSFDTEVNGLQFYKSDAYLKYFGENIGNMAFVYAMSTQIPGKKEYYSNTRKSIERIKDENDVLIFPAANNINQTGDMGWLAKLIEGTDLPIAIVGLGVQASIAEPKFDVPAGTKRLFDVVRDRKIKIGVRGIFTQEFVFNYGIDTAVVTGCPSNFINPDPDLGKILEKKYSEIHHNLKSIALNLEYFRLNQREVHVVTNWLSKYYGALVLQSDEHVFSVLRNDFAADENKLKWMGKYFIGDANADNFVSWLVRYGRIFCHVPSWMDFLRGVTLSVGSRFHGNMLALQSITPAIVFPHDTRTLEMCQTMNVPYFPWDDLKEGMDLPSVVSSINFSGSMYDTKRSALAREYMCILSDIGIDIAEHVKLIAANQ